jgi:hypothetical protein
MDTGRRALSSVVGMKAEVRPLVLAKGRQLHVGSSLVGLRGPAERRGAGDPGGILYADAHPISQECARRTHPVVVTGG